MRNALVTGATAGIGLALAGRLASDARLLLTGSGIEPGPGLPPGSTYVCADQRHPEAATEAILRAIAGLGWQELDLAVLNAGVGFAGDPAGESAATIRETLDTNAVTPILLARALFPLLCRAAGRLVLIGSGAYRGNERFASYAASKAALNGFGRSLAEEWRGRVTVQVIHPGPTASGMHAKAGLDVTRTGRFFLSTPAMASMIERSIEGRHPCVMAGYRRYFLSAQWLRRDIR